MTGKPENRMYLVDQAVKFLRETREGPGDYKSQALFLKDKGLTNAEIIAAFTVIVGNVRFTSAFGKDPRHDQQ